MQIDTAGTYTLKYTAEDACGNVTEVTREVVAEVPITYRTVIYADHTLIINEKSTDFDANVAEHGPTSIIYDPMLADGSNYIFDSGHLPPWATRNDVYKVEIGSVISPVDLSYWFYRLSRCNSVDLSNLDTSQVTSMECTFFNCYVQTIVGMDGFNTSNLTTMQDMFNGCSNLTSLDLSSFDTRLVTNTERMFYFCRALQTILASPNFVVSQVTSSDDMFDSMSVNLVGGAGTQWQSSSRVPKDKTYARIDNPPDAPGFFTAKA